MQQKFKEGKTTKNNQNKKVEKLNEHHSKGNMLYNAF